MKKYILVAAASAMTMLVVICAVLFCALGGTMERVTDAVRLIGTWQYVESRYVGDITERQLMDGAIAGMMNALGDKHSVYMDEEKFKQLTEQNEGSFGGIGVVMAFPEPGTCEIMTVMEGTPGEAAGLVAKDAIIKVDGQDIKEMQPEEIAKKIRGQEGTEVVLTIKRQDQEPFDVTLTRASIPLITAKGTMVKDLPDGEKIGYIRIASFSENTAKEFKAELASLKEQGMQGLIIDLRSNPGGLLSDCVAIASDLLPEGEIVSLVDRRGNKEIYKSTGAGADFPIVVLIDENSASASEILAGAIQDTQCGTIVGKKSFGKGSVQNVIPLFHGDGIKLTIAKYYTPSGRSIDGVGVEPDVEVEQPKEATVDEQLQKAIEVMRDKLKE